MIFAAGLGTRLKPITDTMPKALVPVGGKPLLYHVISRLQSQGVDAFVVNAHHFAGQIADYLEEEDFGDARIELIIEKDAPLETGGGLRNASGLLAGSGHFLAHNVDIVSNADIRKMAADAFPEALATLLVSPRKTNRYLLFDRSMRLVGWTNTATGEVRSPFANLKIEECSKYAFSGIHYISEKILPLLQQRQGAFPIMDFYLESAAAHPIYGYVQEGLEVTDIGKMETLALASRLIGNDR